MRQPYEPPAYRVLNEGKELSESNPPSNTRYEIIQEFTTFLRPNYQEAERIIALHPVELIGGEWYNHFVLHRITPPTNRRAKFKSTN